MGKSADALLVRLLCLTEMGLVVCSVLGLDSVVSALFTLTFLLTAALWAASAAKRMHPLTLLAAVIVALAVFHVLMNAAVNRAELSFSHMRKVIMFAAAVICILLGATHRADGSVERFVLRGNTLAALFLTAMYALGRESMYAVNDRVGSYLTFRFSNPNTAGMFLVAICGLELAALRRSKGWLGRVLHFGLALCLTYFTVETGSRTALLVLLAEGVFFLWTLPARGKRFTFRRWFCVLIAVLPLIFAGVYLAVVELPGFERLLHFLVEEGKPLTSRAEIWREALRYIADSPFLGAYSQLGGSFQMHNSHLDILASYGLPVLALTCVFLYRVLRISGKAGLEGDRAFCLFAFCALLMLGVGEAALFSGGLGICLYAGAFLMLANGQADQTQEKGGVML